MHSRFILLTLCFSFLWITTYAQMSPWGTGTINNQLIGNLQDTTVVFPSQSGYGNYGYYPNPNALLPTYTYDIYIPPSYDGTKPYGLVTFINSGNNGGLFPQWQQVLDEKELIYIAGDNIGNSINVNIRMGVAMAAVYRLKEVLNIDSTRIYTSGNSGGGRMSSVLAYTYPEWFFGAVPNCGSSYPRQVAQDYETQNPNSHYEYTIPFTTADLNYIKSFDRRYGIMTSFDDFREGDIMNIYHNGMVPDGYKGKFLETAGPHCATTTQHFRDAINFVEHPYIPLVEDDFTSSNPTVGDGFKINQAMVQNGHLELMPTTTMATAYSKNPFQWNDAKGGILSTTVQCDSATYSKNSNFHLGLWTFADPTIYCDAIGNMVLPGKAGILATIAYNDNQPTLSVVIENPNQGLVSDTIFQATFSDWMPGTALDIKYHIWDQELRMEFGKHFGTPQRSSIAAKLLDDDRSIRIRWADFGLTGVYWDAAAWESGALLTYAAEKIDTTLASTTIRIDDLEIYVADTNNVAALPIDQVTIIQINDSLVAPMGLGTYQWYLDSVALPGDTTYSIDPTQNGVYNVSILTGTNCEVWSNPIAITIVGISGLEADNSVRVFPNPNKGAFFVETKMDAVRIEVINALGQLVQQEYANGNSTQAIQLKDASKGIYFVRVTNQTTQKEQVYKMLVE